MYRNLENKDTIILNKVSLIYVIMEYTKVPIDIFKPIRDLIKIGLYKDEQEALRDLVHEKANLKIFHYTKKIKEMESKYNLTFSEFKENIYTKAEEENFEEWDDFILWESYVKGRQY